MSDRDEIGSTGPAGPPDREPVRTGGHGPCPGAEALRGSPECGRGGGTGARPPVGRGHRESGLRRRGPSRRAASASPYTSASTDGGPACDAHRARATVDWGAVPHLCAVRTAQLGGVVLYGARWGCWTCPLRSDTRDVVGHHEGCLNGYLASHMSGCHETATPHESHHAPVSAPYHPGRARWVRGRAHHALDGDEREGGGQTTWTTRRY